MENLDGISIFKLGDIKLQSGATLNDAKLAYKTFGTLNADKSNVILYPTWFTGFVSDNEWLVGNGMALDPENYFIIIVCAFGNGQSSSPSNTPAPHNGRNFPPVSLYDNVTQQRRLVDSLGIIKLKLVVGWSMGAQQSYQWASLYPEMVERVAPLQGSARTAHHNFVFLEGVKAALTADEIWRSGKDEKPTVGLRAVARVYAGWGFSQPFYRDELWRQLGYASLEEFLVGFWEGFWLKRDPANLLAMLSTWQGADISKNPTFNGDFKAAMKAITCPAIIMPAEIDLYFPKEDSADEVALMSNAVLDVVPGYWGHFAGGGLNPVDTKYIDDALKRLLAQ